MHPVILFAHGSNHPEWLEPFHRLAADLQQALGTDAVYLAFIGNAKPGLTEAVQAVLQTPARRCRLLPLFLAKGTHFYETLRRQIEGVEKQFPELEVELMEPVGLHPLFVDLVRRIIVADGQEENSGL